MKDLFVPFREQKLKMQKGRSYIVHLHVDEESYRLNGFGQSGTLFVGRDAPYREGDEVQILVWQKTDLGFKVIVDNRFSGLVYENDLFPAFTYGRPCAGYIKQVRPDGKLDITLQKQGREAVDDFSQVLLEHLQHNAGRTPLCDKSPAEEIYAMFGVSKKVFKKGRGRPL